MGYRQRQKGPHSYRRSIARVLLCVATGWSREAHAVTLVSGGELGDQTWTESGSPYLVNDDLIVPEGKVLTLEAGTSVIVGSSDLSATGEYGTLIELRVRGELYVNGTSSKPVRIWNEDSSSQVGWYGIVLEPELTAARLLNVQIANAYSCLESRALTTNVELSSVTFSTCDAGAYLVGSVAKVDRVLVQGSEYGLWLDGARGALVTNLIARGNAKAIYVAESQVSIRHATFHDNALGILASGSSAVMTDITLSNSIVSETTPPFKINSNATLTVTDSNVFPDAAPSAHVTLGSGMLAVDPGFVAAPEDLHLLATSGCIDAGSSTLSSDHDIEHVARPLDGDGDGALAPDLGAHEFFRRASCGDGHVEGSEACDDGDANGAYGFCNEACSGSGPACGDGVLDELESCDDGGLTAGDGCNATCGLEAAGGASGGGLPGGGSAGGGTPAGGTSSGAGSAGAASGGSAGGGGMPNHGTGGNEGSSLAGSPEGGAAGDVDPAVGPSERGQSGSVGLAGSGSMSGGRAAGGSRHASEAGASSPDASGGEPPTPGDPACEADPSGTCDCPDGSHGVRRCESDGNAICFCSVTVRSGAEGCGCRVTSRASRNEPWFAALLLLGFARRRARARSSAARLTE